MIEAKFVIKQFLIFSFFNFGKCSIDGLSYMDPTNRRPSSNLYPRGEDPCNPLYWYPRNIPEYCYYKNFPIPQKPVPPPLTVPIPVPQPNIIMPIPALPAAVPGLAPLPYGAPIPPCNPMLPVASSEPVYPPISYPYQTYPQQTGMIPGLPGLVTKDGGINILPFSDAYSDLLENHKNRMIRKRLEKLIRAYEDFPNGRSYDRLRKYARRNIDIDM